MSDLISRQDAKSKKVYSHERHEYVVPVAELDWLPSAGPKTGEWIKATGMMPPEFHGHHCCSECGNFANMEPPFGNREDLSKFCPNCGARMVNNE